MIKLFNKHNFVIKLERFLSASRSDVEKARDVSRLHPYLKAREQYQMFDYDESPKQWPKLTKQEYWAIHGDVPSKNINAALCWQTVEEINNLNEDRLRYDLDIHQRMKIIEERKYNENEERINRQNQLLKNIEKLPQELIEFDKRRSEDKVKDDLEDKQRYDLLDFARDYYGFDIDTNDERMQMMIAELEDQQKLEQKKLRKAERAKLTADKLQKMLSDISNLDDNDKSLEKQDDKKF
ncbi:hypothetical protein GJ496_005126 [Pomphorhynchus laevis]|nr:hypothetical protein GJ496_005126 [Pomphorhynchus laevis]